jgi:hypothetical protein
MLDGAVAAGVAGVEGQVGSAIAHREGLVKMLKSGFMDEVSRRYLCARLVGRYLPGGGCAMPIWLHRVLGVAVQAAGFFGGGIAGALVGALLFRGLAAGTEGASGSARPGYLLVMAVAAAFFFGGLWLGRGLAYTLYLRSVSARCPQCGGRAFLHSEDARRVRYRCRTCRHVHVGESWEE